MRTFLLFIFFSTSLQAQVSWPAITQTSKPWSRWWWQGSAVNKKDLTAALALYKNAGLGGMEITPIYGVKGHESEFINYLSPRWIEMFQYTLAEAKRLGLGIDMANGTGWPFGGPWVTPEDACKNVYQKVYNVKEGEKIEENIRYLQQPFYRSESRMKVDLKTLSYPVETNRNLQQYAFDQVRYEMLLKPFLIMGYSNHGEIIELTAMIDTAGKLNWTALPGTWKVYALFMGYHGKMVERSAPGGEGNVIDHFSGKALTHYLSRFDNAFKGKDLTGLRSFFNDSYEVDDAKGQSNWTPDLLNEFRKRRGYKIENYLPLLFERDSSETGRRVLADYRQTISDLLLDNFTVPWQNWAKRKTKLIRNQSHGSPANILDHYAVVDIPETEGADILRFKFATSAAHVTGKKWASSETATWLNEHFQSSLSDVKQAVDKYFIGGVNHVFWHGTSYSPQNEPWPGWLFYAAVHFTPANPFWKDFSTLNNYVARCQSFLQKGKPDNDILLYFPFNDRITEMGRDLLLHFDGMEGFEKTAFRSNAAWMLEKGYAFDFISDKQVAAIPAKDHTLQTGGINYKTIVFSDIKYIPAGTFDKLIDLAAKGNTILFYKHIPSDVPGMQNLGCDREHLKRIIDSLSFKSLESGIKKADIGKGSFLIGDDLQLLLEAAKVNRETMVDKGLQYTRRSYEGGHYYFMSNPGKRPVNEWIELQVRSSDVLIFNPMTLVAGKARTKKENGTLKVFVQLQPGESCILQATYKTIAARAYPYYQTTGTPFELKNKWQLSFISGGPVLPNERQIGSLGSWTMPDSSLLNSFSGTAKYSIHFSLPSAKAENYLLDLGRVEESAEVILNGKKLMVLLGPQYQLVIPSTACKKDNLLEIIVTNSMANRIAYMDQQNIPWKKFYNTNFPSRLAENRNSDGIFSAGKWQPKASGLLGPVTLQAVEWDNR